MVHYRIYGCFNSVEHSIFAKTKGAFYKRFKALMAGLDVGEYEIYTRSKGQDTTFFNYEKKGYNGDNYGRSVITTWANLSKVQVSNLVQGVLV